MITTKTTVETLVLQSQRGDASAYGLLYEKHLIMVLAATTKIMESTHDAEDVTHDVFLHALSKLHQLKRPASFPGWIRTMARRMAINASIRKKPKLLRHADNKYIEEARDEKTIEAIDRINSAERRTMLMEGLSRLKPIDRQTLEIFYFDDLSIIEMGDVFNAPLGTIKRRLHVARKRLRHEISAYL